MKKLTRIFALLLAVMLLLTACKADTKDTETTESTEPPVEIVYGEDDVFALDSYTVSTAEPDVMNAVIAVDASGEPQITNATMQVGYWRVFYEFMNSYSSYVTILGLDYNTRLDVQACPEMVAGTEGYTWEQFFLETAALQLAENYALAEASYAAGYELSEEDASEIDDVADPNGSLATEAKEGGYESTEAYLQASFGKGVTIESYQEYLRSICAAGAYFNERKAEFTEAADDAVAEAYFDENAAYYEENRLQKVNNVSVRHILIAPQGDKDEETGDWTEEQWAAAEAEANDLYALWQENPTEENFAALVADNTADESSIEDGGLYEDFATDAMVAEFTAWSFDQSRVAGDTGIVKTSFGFHIMYFVEQTETRTWLETARTDLINEKINEHIAALCEQYPLRYSYESIRIFDLITASVTASAAG